MPHGRLEEILAATFGITAAIIAVGGWILVRILRDRQQFRLMQAALERGLTSIPGIPPAWLASLRQGVIALVLGLGILVGGAVLARTADSIDAPPSEPQLNRSTPGQPSESGGITTMPAAGRMPPPPDRVGPPPSGRDRPGMREGPPMQEPPPRRSPAFERWQRIQSQRLTGNIAMIAGGILVLLGLVRIIFAFAEKKYVSDITAPGSAKV